MVRNTRELVENVIDLPTLPQVASAIITLVDDPNSSVRDLNQIMSQDPSMAAKILKLVNSAYYGLTNKVSDLGHAISLLGYSTIKSIALSVSVFDVFENFGDNPTIDKVVFWKHSIATAAAARTTAEAMPGLRVDPGDVFSAGLLHDIGIIVLDQYAPDVLEESLVVMREKKITYHEAELELLTDGHDELGAFLADRWGLPSTLVTSLRDHHALPNTRTDNFTSVIAFADYVSSSLTVDDAQPILREPHLDIVLWNALGLSKDFFVELADKAKEAIAEVDSMLADSY